MNAPQSAQELHAQMKALGKVVKAQKPTKPRHEGKPAGKLSVPELRERLKTQRDALLGKATAGVWFDGESREWAHIGHGLVPTLGTTVSARHVMHSCGYAPAGAAFAPT